MDTLSSTKPARRLVGVIGALFACALLASLWLVLGSSPAAGSVRADAYPPVYNCTVSVSTGTVHAGQSVTVTGSGFPANTTVQLSVEATPATSLGSVTTDGNGSFTVTLTMPKNLSGSGHHLVAASGSETCSFAFTVPSPSPSTSTPPKTTTPPPPSNSVGGVSTSATPQSQPTEPLATTGFQTAAATTIAVILLAGGITLVLLGRRRRHN
jgi:hypothetical protein